MTKGVVKDMKIVKKRLITGLICALFLLSESATVLRVAADGEEKAASSALSYSGDENSYYDYLSSFGDAERPEDKVSVSLADFTTSRDAEISYGAYQGKNNVLIWNNGSGSVDFKFSVAVTGLYRLTLNYFPISTGSVSYPEFEVYLDGKLPFSECVQISVPRVFADDTYNTYEDSDFDTDNRGNEVIPNTVETPQWMNFSIRDDTGANRDPYSFYLTEGEHVLRLVALRDPIAISGITFENTAKIPSYSEYASEREDVKVENVLITVEAEKAFRKTSPTLYPISNKTSTATTPIDPYATRLNTIGGSNWSSPMQSITWEFEAPKDGLYKIGMRFRQNFLRGLYTVRSVQIDGESLFEELSDIRFSYSGNWQLKVLGDEESFEIYLTKGRHTLTLTPTVTEISDDILTVNTTVKLLNELYSDIIMVTGADPDMYRDYYLDDTIPGLMDGMKKAADTLKEVSQRLQEITGGKGGMSASLDRVYEQLESFIDNPDSIPMRISNFQSNISALASWVFEVRQQSLLLDKIYIVGSEDSFPEIENSWWNSFSFHVKSFLSSFVGDYTSIGNTYDKDEALYIWLNGSRDVAGVLKTIIDSDFTAKTGIKVNANISTTSLLAAIMADKGPDVALSVARGEPVNLAARNAVVPLNELEGFDEIITDFSDSALTAYYYKDKCYGLPVSQTFLVMFYRKDILSELELEPPKTWTEMYAVAEALQRNNMNIGLPVDLFYTLLFQMGGSLYNEELTATTLDTPISYNAFKMWCDFYTQYGIPLYKNDYNRFRTGESPIVIVDYSFYNQLYATAPEIRNMWAMTEIPGIEDENGNINNTSAASGAACVLLSDAKYKDDAWEFLKWWVSGETQGRYANQVESILGVISRATPASRTAMNRIPWTNSEFSVLLSQWGKIQETQEIPGSYYTTRNISNAFNDVYYNGSNARQTLSAWNKEINSELERKRIEFEYAE